METGKVNGTGVPQQPPKRENLFEAAARWKKERAAIDPEYAERMERLRKESQCQTRVTDCTGGTADSCGVKMPRNR